MSLLQLPAYSPPLVRGPLRAGVQAHVLKDLHGHAQHGEMVALMGESGSGKSTLLNILHGQARHPHRPILSRNSPLWRGANTLRESASASASYISLSRTPPCQCHITSRHPPPVFTWHQASYGTTTGRLDLNGRPFEPWALTHMIGFVPQAYILFDELTVYENIMLAVILIDMFAGTSHVPFTCAE